MRKYFIYIKFTILKCYFIFVPKTTPTLQLFRDTSDSFNGVPQTLGRFHPFKSHEGP